MRRGRRAATLVALLLGGLVLAGRTHAHEIRPALLDVTEGPGGTLQVTWKVVLVAVVGVLAALRRMPLRSPQAAWRLAPYTIGSLAAFWTIQRVVSAFSTST